MQLLRIGNFTYCSETLTIKPYTQSAIFCSSRKNIGPHVKCAFWNTSVSFQYQECMSPTSAGVEIGKTIWRKSHCEGKACKSMFSKLLQGDWEPGLCSGKERPATATPWPIGFFTYLGAELTLDSIQGVHRPFCRPSQCCKHSASPMGPHFWFSSLPEPPLNSHEQPSPPPCLGQWSIQVILWI